MIVLGLISGTSADGIDAAVVELSGAPPDLHWHLITHLTIPHPPALRAEILACTLATATVDKISALNFALGDAFAKAARAAMQAAHLRPEQIDLIGSHGQTVWHAPRAHTLQIGAAAVIAEKTGVTTISNFRARDVAAGGHGAPLVPYVDALLFSHPTLTRAAQNIGGIANVTFLPPHSKGAEEQWSRGDREASPPHPRSPAPLQPFAFDTGPGNVLIDDAARRATNGAMQFDRDGALAARGTADEKLLAELLAHPYFKLPSPKTTGREIFGAHFGADVWTRGIARGLRSDDILATLTALTAESIARAHRDFLPAMPDQVILSGGGARNPTLVAMLRAKLAPARVILSDELGMPVEAKEAIAFAILAYETAHNRPSNLPAATGARSAVVLGDITPGRGADKTTALTEAINPATRDIDALPTLEMLAHINAEDARVADAVRAELPGIARAVDEIAARMKRGGRLIYIGAGTSGRLGILDASEMPPTFSTPSDLVVGIIAGGREAMFRAVEGAEDDADAGARDLAAVQIAENDSVVGLSASGRTPYVIGALKFAREHGALTISVACNRPAPIQESAEINIAPLVGAEVIAGSTRLKAGTAQKIILNMLSAGVMIKLGKTYGNLMVDVQPTNAKLRDRAVRIVETACGIPRADAEARLRECNGEVKTAIVAHLARVAPDLAREKIKRAAGSVRGALANGKW